VTTVPFHKNLLPFPVNTYNMTFQNETSPIPFWAEGKGFINGRDPLGIQNSSVSIYSVLLPGLNNVTHRLRYYGFYCWLIDSINQRRVEFPTPTHQYNYIRKAEYALALYMSHYEPNARGVAGSEYAQKNLPKTKIG